MAFSNSFALGIVIGGSVDATVGRSFQSLEQRAAATDRRLKKLTLGKTLASDVSKYRTQLLQLQAARKEGAHDSAALSEQIGRAMAQYRRAADKAREYGIDVKRLADEQRQLSVQIGRTTRAMERQKIALRNRDLRQDLRGQILGAVGTAYAVSVPFRAALAFDEQKTRLSTLLEGEKLQKTVRQALELGRSKKNLATQDELLGINYALNSAGLDDAASRAGARIVAKVKEVTGGSAERVGEVVGTVFNNMAGSLAGSTEQKLARIGDILTKTQFKYQIRDFGQLGESFKEGSKGAIKYNVDLAQTAAVLGQFNSAGLQGSPAGTAFNAMLRQMTKAADQFGFSIERNADGSLDLMATLANLDESLAGFDDADEKADALQEAFGDEGSGVVLLLNNLKALKEGYRQVRDESAGLVDKSYEKFLASSSGQLKILRNQVRGLGIGLGSVLLPGVNAVISPLGTGINTVAELSERFPRLTQFVVGAAVGLAGLKIAAMGGRYAFTFLSDGVQVAKGVMDFFRLSSLKTNAVLVAQKGRVTGAAVAQRAGAVATGLLTAAQWAWNAAMTANPIGLVIAGVAALAAGGVWLYKKWQPFQILVDKIWAGFKMLVEHSAIGLLFKAGKTVFGLFGDKKSGAPSGPAAAVASAAAVPAAAIAAPAGGRVNNNQQYQIAIHPQPGMDERAIGEEVRRQLENREARAAAGNRGVLYD